MAYDYISPGNCDTNFSNSALMTGFRTTYAGHPSATPYPKGYPGADISRDEAFPADQIGWLLRFEDSVYVSGTENWEPPDYKKAIVEVNIHPPVEYRIWICMRCTNQF